MTAGILFIALPLPAQTPVPYQALNSGADDYAPAMRMNGTSIAEIWLTSGRDDAGRSRRIFVNQVAPGRPLPVTPIAEPINRVAGFETVQLDGCPTFSVCDPDYGVFSSNRPYNGDDYDNDLYGMRSDGAGWRVDRLDNLSSKGWDDTPSLSPDGRFLYFASDRVAPGSGRTDLYLASRSGNGWGDPVPVALLNTTDYSEQTPLAAVDGYLYYSTDREGDYDIWRVQIDRNTGLPTGQPAPVSFPGVNERGSNEGHPAMSPNGDSFLFSSDRGASGGDLDIYYTEVVRSAEQVLRVRVLTRELEFDRATGGYYDVTRPMDDSVSIFGAGAHRTERTEKGELMLRLSDIAASDAIGPSGERTLILGIKPEGGRFLPVSDTITYSSLCADTLDHTLYLWDTTVYFSARCRQDFPVTNVRFFITGYWCPTTRQYERYTPCRSVFDHPELTSVENCPPAIPPTAEDDLYIYRVQQPAIILEEQADLCIRWGELREQRDDFAAGVDSAIGLYLDNMRSALQAPCVRQAIDRGDTVRIYVTGWTDPRDIHEHCRYTGESITFDGAPIKLRLSDGTIARGILPHGIGFREYDRAAGVDRITEGNQLLSELRAWFTARLLDALWAKEIAEYRELKGKGTLEIVASGKAINQDELPFERRRSVDVAIEAPVVEGRTAGGIASGATMTGGRVSLCARVCQ